LLLDEPAAGLNDEESNDLLKVVNGIREDTEFGCGILIIDHDLWLIMRLCDSVHVLDEGKTIAEGLQNDVRHNFAVINSYLVNSKNLD
jgi:branched-chain amino acid transport system ATP-binding protein